MALACGTFSPTWAQSEIYPEHFDLEEVTLLDGPFKRAMTVNNRLLLQYDVDRLLTPFIRQAGLTTDASSKYYRWEQQHPSFSNWGLSSWSLEGHVGGHYLTALALAYAASHDAAEQKQLKERIDYILSVLNDCQKAFDKNTEGMKGFLGGQPINQIWTGLYKRDLGPFKQYGGWVPFYCEHKVLAGLRDVWIYTDSKLAKQLYKGICDWSVNVVSNLTEAEMQDILGWEHGGMNETLADAYRLFGDAKYLTAAKKYSHRYMVDNMQTLNTTFLDGKHANTQVPKYIGFERIYQEDLRDGHASASTTYQKAAHNFWQDVATNRTVCIGGNSVSEHFQAASRGSQYIDNLEGPESCNSNNMLKLSEDLFDETHDARYADFYEGTMWNHILSTQDPETGGYVYFTSLRPQSYRIYSQVNQGMWCCVGTGMENHGKYGHFIYTHSTDNKILYVNLFTASQLTNKNFAITQQTAFPEEQSTTLTIDKAGTFTLALRHPAWAGEGYAITINGEEVSNGTAVTGNYATVNATTPGQASYVQIARTWKKGDVIKITLPMALSVEPCPNYTDYVAFKYGPILLAAQNTAATPEEATATGLTYEKLQNEFGGEGRMDHSPGAMAKPLPLSSSPLLIGPREKVLERITPLGGCRFTIDASSKQSKGGWTTLTLRPFYDIHHARYTCYWYQQTEENYAKSDMGQADARAEALLARTIDFVATGEQQSEAGHDALYSTNSSKGNYNGEYYRDAQSGGYMQYTLANTGGKVDSVAVMCRFTTADKGRKATLYVDGEKLTDIEIPSSVKNAESNGFYNVEYLVPVKLLKDAKGKVKPTLKVRLAADKGTLAPGLYYLRLVSGYEDGSYKFVATEWKTGDSNRLAQGNISYDEAGNTLTCKAGTGNNNVCLTLDWAQTDYTVKAADKFLIVKGTNLSLASGKSYLWWLNGTNKGSQVVPQYVGRAADRECVIAWDITKSNLDANCQGDTWNVSTGQTIFGLTSSTGTSRISYIGFQPSVESFLEAVGIENLTQDPQTPKQQGVFTIDGRKLRSSNNTNGLPHGLYIVAGEKVSI